VENWGGRQNHNQIVEDTAANEDETLAKLSLHIIEILGSNITPAPKIVACKECKIGLSPQNVVKHARDEHGVPISRSLAKIVRSIIDNYDLLKKCQDVQMQSRGPPVQGIAICAGYWCTLCDACVPARSSLATHLSSDHKSADGGIDVNGKAGYIQTLFRFSPKYFSVLPTLANHLPQDAWWEFIHGPAREIDAIDISNKPLDPKEIPPLLRLTQWHDYIGEDVLEKKAYLRKLKTLTDLPMGDARKECTGNRLRKTVVLYMQDIRQKALRTTLSVRTLLMECPRLV